MSFDVLPEEELTDRLLAVFYHAAHTKDRQGDDPKAERHHATGLVASVSDLAPRHEAVRGKQLALELVVRPREFASGIGRRADATNPRGSVPLSYFPESQWTDSELDWVNDLELQVKRLVHKLTERSGWFVLEVDVPVKLELGDDGYTRAFKITYDGLKEAFERIPKGRFAQAPQSLRDDVSGEAWRSAPKWARDEAGKASVFALLCVALILSGGAVGAACDAHIANAAWSLAVLAAAVLVVSWIIRKAEASDS